MKFLLSLLLLVSITRATAQDQRDMLIIVSAAGNATYAPEFQRQATTWQNLASQAEISATTFGLGEETKEEDLSLVEKNLTALPKAGGDLWLVLIGHGSFDGRTANFNLRGKDLDPAAFKSLLNPFTRRLIILNLFSASYPFLAPLAGENRIIISSNRSEGERNYSRFGAKFADALTSPAADLDLDGSSSLLEITLHASAATQAFYQDAQRVLQEHAVLDDNGDAFPTPTTAFIGLQAAPSATTPPDGPTAREIYLLNPTSDPLPPVAKAQRAELEASIATLRQNKPNIQEQEYYVQLENLMRKMAEIYQKK